MHSGLLSRDASLCQMGTMPISSLWDVGGGGGDAFSQCPCWVCGSDPVFSLGVWDQVSVSIQDLWDGSPCSPRYAGRIVSILGM